jgi:hypothetical protein
VKVTSTYKIVAIGMALLVLCSTFSFTVQKHYCGDVLVDTSVFTEVERCCAHGTDTSVLSPNPCCKDEVTLIKGQKELKISLQAPVAFYKKHLKKDHVCYQAIERIYAYKRFLKPKKYVPPKLIPDILVLDQVFLI